MCQVMPLSEGALVPEDLAGSLVYLVSDGAALVIRQLLVVNGGANFS